MALETRNYLIDVALGNYPGARLEYMVGDNNVVPAVTPMEDLWGGDGVIPELTSASLFDIVSSSANDAAAGTGARTVKVYGIDGNLAEASETVTMNGTNTVATVNTYLQVYAIKVLTVGSNNSNFGVIDAQIATTDHIKMTASYNTTHHGMRIVPAGYRCLVLDVWMGAGKSVPAANCDGAIYTKVPTTQGGTGLWERMLKFRFGTIETFRHIFPLPLSFPPGSRIKLSGNSDAANTIITGACSLLYVPV
jgi:hypothetical protein